MTCKTETRGTFQLITPLVAQLDNTLKTEINGLVEECEEKELSAILDFSNLETCDLESLDFIQTLHYQMYSSNYSFVVTQASEVIKGKLVSLIEDENINYAPTLAEAIDIVSMEDIERELLGGE